MVATIARLSTYAIEHDSQAPGGSGYDHDFREPVVVPTADGIGVPDRKELEAVDVRCQVEMRSYEELRQGSTGNMPPDSLTLVLHFCDLEAQALVDPLTRRPLFCTGDRLVSLSKCTGELTQSFPDPPGMFATQVQPRFGLGGERNLLLIEFQARDRGLLRV